MFDSSALQVDCYTSSCM